MNSFPRSRRILSDFIKLSETGVCVSVRPGLSGMLGDELDLVGWCVGSEVTGKPRGMWG